MHQKNHVKNKITKLSTNSGLTGTGVLATAMYFSFNFAWCSIQLTILSVNNRGWVFLLNRQTKSQKKDRKSKSQRLTQSTAYLNNYPVIRSSSQKHLGIHLYEKFNFIHHIKEKKFQSQQRC